MSLNDIIRIPFTRECLSHFIFSKTFFVSHFFSSYSINFTPFSPNLTRGIVSFHIYFTS